MGQIDMLENDWYSIKPCAKTQINKQKTNKQKQNSEEKTIQKGKYERDSLT